MACPDKVACAKSSCPTKVSRVCTNKGGCQRAKPICAPKSGITTKDVLDLTIGDVIDILTGRAQQGLTEY